MRNFFRQGWDLGIIALAVGLPIAAALLYILGISLWEVVSNPAEYWMLWLYIVILFVPSLIQRSRQKNEEADGMDTHG